MTFWAEKSPIQRQKGGLQGACISQSQVPGGTCFSHVWSPIENITFFLNINEQKCKYVLICVNYS